MNIEDTPNYGELKRLSDAIGAETDSTKRNELIKERAKFLDPRMKMLPCGITKGNNNIIGLIAAKIPIRGEFDFVSVYNNIPQEDFNNAHGHIGSWASAVTGGVDVCFKFFKEEGFITSNSDNRRSALTEKGLLLKEKGDYEKYVDFILSEKEMINQLQTETRRLAHRQAILAERQVWINLCIAIGVAIAGVYYTVYVIDYFSQLISKKYPLFYSKGVTFYLLLLGGLIGTSTTLTIQQWNRARRKKQSNRT